MKNLILAIAFLPLFASAYELPSLDSDRFCVATTDCAAATCCHPKSAVNKEFAPDCRAVMCTEHCEPNSLDCGQAKIECIQNQCEVVPNVQ